MIELFKLYKHKLHILEAASENNGLFSVFKVLKFVLLHYHKEEV